MARHKVPTAIKEVRGSYKKHPERRTDGEPTPTRGIGPPPEHFDEAHQALWNEVVSVMYAGVLGEADRLALETMVRLVYLMRTDFENMTAAQITRLTGLFGQFGMTPADRTKITIPKDKKSNPFEGF